MRKTATILDQILEHKARELSLAKQRTSLQQLQRSLKDRQTELRDFRKSLSQANRLAVIAEIKKASPSAGVLVAHFDHLNIAREYQRSKKVDAISVLTEEEFFQGSLGFISEIKKVTTIPIFRKDFIFDEYQIYESYLAESDALLLIAAVLEMDELCHLLQLSEKLGMAVLVETHSQEEVEMAIKAGASIIGINARNLHTFEMDKNLFASLAAHLPATTIKVAESGLETPQEVQQVYQAGANAVLVGTSIMKAPNKRQKIEELLSFE